MGAFSVLVTLLVLVYPAVGLAAVSQTMRANVLDDNTVHLQFADGTEVGAPTAPGPTIPAGTYTIEVNDDSELDNIHISGPGVDMSSGGVVANVQATWTITFQPGSSYRYTSDAHTNYGGYFQTAGSSSGVSTSSSSPSSGSNTSSSSGSSSSGSAVPSSSASSSSSSSRSAGSGSAFVAVLRGGAGAAGKPTLHRGGKVVSRLKPGRYKVVVTDRTTRHGFAFKNGGHSIAISGVASVGVRSVIVELTAGRWSFALTGAPSSSVAFTVAG